MNGSKTDSSRGGQRRRVEWCGRMVAQYRLIEYIGRGSMATVLRAQDVTLKRQVAIKVFPQRVQEGRKTVQLEQFMREAQSVARLDHPHIVRVFEAGQFEGWAFIAMEWIDGCDLEQLVSASGPLDIVRACALAAEAAQALHYAHAQGVIHRDIKPGNLMLTRAGRCKVTDFGLARIDDPSDGFELPTESVGTPYYIAPEVARGLPADERSDVYSLSATLWHLLTGAPPFTAATQRELLSHHIRSPVPRLCETWSDAPYELDRLLQRGLSKQPAERFTDAAELSAALHRFTIPLPELDLQPLARSAAIVDRPHQSPPAPPGNAFAAALRTGLVAALFIAVAGLVGTIAFSHAMTDLPAESVAMAQPPLDEAQIAAELRDAMRQERSEQVIPTPVASDAAQPQPDALRPAESREQLPPPPVAAPDVDSFLLAATETDRFRAILTARDNRVYRVRGLVTRAALSSTGKSFRIELDNAAGFFAVVFPQHFEQMGQRFGGENGEGLLGRQVTIAGRLSSFRDQPQVVIDDPDQVAVEHVGVRAIPD